MYISIDQSEELTPERVHCRPTLRFQPRGSLLTSRRVGHSLSQFPYDRFDQDAQATTSLVVPGPTPTQGGRTGPPQEFAIPDCANNESYAGVAAHALVAFTPNTLDRQNGKDYLPKATQWPQMAEYETRACPTHRWSTAPYL